MADIRINPQTGEVIELKNGHWSAVPRSRLATNSKGELAVLDGGAWQIAGRVGPTKEAAATQEQRQASYLRSQNVPDVFSMPAIRPGLPRDTLAEIRNTPLDQFTGTAQQVADTMLLGGGNELMAALRSVPAMMPGGESPADAFNRNLQRYDTNQQDFQFMNPGLSAAATTAGVVLNPLNLLGGEAISMGRTAAGRARQAAKYGGAIGGTSGFLGTKGDVGDRLIGAGVGAGGGATLGAVAQPGMELLGFGARKGAEAGRAVYETLKNQAAASKNPAQQADKLIAQAFMRDNMLSGLPQRQPLPGQGLVNMGGENVTALGRGATVAPGPSRQRAAEFFGEQSAGAPDRAADALKGLTDLGYYGTAETLDLTRKTAAKPLYDVAYAKPSVETWTPRIAELMKRPSMKSAYARAQRIAAEEGRDPKELGLDFNEAGDPVFLAGADKAGKIPSTQTMDYIKRGLDDVVEQFRDKTTGKLVLDTEGRAINNTRAEFLGILKEGNPDYAKALESWGGPSHALDMLQYGRDIYKARGNPADVLKRFSEMSPVDKEMARVGFVRDAIADLGNTGDSGSVYLKLMGNQNKRAVLEALFPDYPSFRKFADQMQAEKAMLGTNRTVMGGSPTARIQADNADMALQGASDVLNWTQAIKSGNPLQIFGLALDKAQNLQRGMTEPVATEVGNRLFQNDPRVIMQYAAGLLNQNVPAPIQSLGRGWLRNTPIAPLLGQGSGLGGAAIATPAPVLPQR